MDPRRRYFQTAADNSYFASVNDSASFPVRRPGDHDAFAADVRRLYADNVSLRQQLSAMHQHCGQQLESLRRHGEQKLEQQRRQSNEQLQSLRNQLSDAHETINQTASQAKRDIVAAEQDRENSRALLQTARDQVVSLHAELKHLADTAAAEQQDLRHSHRLEMERQQALLRDRDATIEKLRSNIADQEMVVEYWKVAQGHAVELSEWYEHEHQKGLRDATRLREEYDRFRSRTSEAFALCEQEIETLEATVSMLGTDHEAVELINADLDHRNDELLFDIDQLQMDLESVLAQATRDRQESLISFNALSTQLHETNIRLITASEEQKSLIETVKKLRVKSDEFDATLFAKDQEIAATSKAADQSRRQLEQLRRESDITANQNEAMRIRIRESMQELNRIQAELSKSAEQVELAESKLAQREQQIREIQSASRAAEANAALRASETEQQFMIELQRLEQELEQRQHSDERYEQSFARLQSKIAEMESSANASRYAASAAAEESSRLQQCIVQLNDQIRIREDSIAELEQELLQFKSDGHALVQSQSDHAAALERIQQLEKELEGWQRCKNPLGEVKRLTAELARLTAQSAGEREALQRRIEQLQNQSISYRAA